MLRLKEDLIERAMQIGTARRRFKVDKIDLQSYFISEAPRAIFPLVAH